MRTTIKTALQVNEDVTEEIERLLIDKDYKELIKYKELLKIYARIKTFERWTTNEYMGCKDKP